MAPRHAGEGTLVLRHRACSHLIQLDGTVVRRPVWFFETIVATPHENELTAIEIEAKDFASPDARLYLFAVAGMRIAD
jgi:hypothetical protein